ncbi:MAG: DNA mismatch repair endonuclease MutL [Deltaproteobacteria bacterium]
MTSSFLNQKVRILPESLINKIAAGEVVERPASVVKELVENALDAGATQIQVTVKNGGKDLIQVLDNGCGMNETDARFAVERHATSKIYSDEDLFRIGTLGFRGEALASIAAVSHFELLTCPDDQESGTRLLMQGGQLDEIGKVGFPQGTRIKIERLFFNTPARLKFLKTTTTELQHIQQGLTNQALAYPQRQFKLVHNQQLLLNLGPANSLEERIFQLFGEEFRDSLQEVSHRENYLNYQGWLSIPEKVRTSKRWQYLFVNDRSVRCPAVQRAIYQGYGNFLSKSQHPAFFLSLHLDPGELDVNVHPAKTEIRLRNSQVVHTILQDQLSRSLKQQTKLRLFGREGKATPRLQDPQTELPLVDELPLQQQVQEQSSVQRVAKERPARAKHNPTLPTPTKNTDSKPEASPVATTAPSSPTKEETPTKAETIGDPVIVENLQLWPTPETPTRWQPHGQVLGCYLLATDVDGLVLFHSRRVHERLLYERYRSDFLAENIEVSERSTPLLLHLAPQEATLLAGLEALMRQGGFVWEPFGGRTFALQQQPKLLALSRAEAFLREMLNRSALFGKRSRPDTLQQDLWNVLATQAALPETQLLTASDQQSLLAQLEQLDLDNRSLDGSPLWFSLPTAELERKFRQRF